MRMIEKMKQYFKKKNLSTMNNRKKVGIILFATSIGLFFLFATRLSYIVLVGKVGKTSLETKTQSLYQGSQVVKAKRGTIYDRNGVPIAEDATSYSMYAVLDESYVSGKDEEGNDIKLYAEPENFDALAEIASTVLDGKISKKRMLEVLKQGIKNGAWQVDIPNGRNITLQERQAINDAMEKEGITGLYFNEHPSRIYPNGTFSSHLIGYADIQVEDNQEELNGVIGLEQVYNDVLKGKDGQVIFQKDNYQNPLPGTTAELEPAEDGQDIYVTLDSRLQSYLETLMTDAWEEAESENLTAVLMEAKTGEIVAMSQRPTFDPETKEEFGDEDFTWFNLFVEDQYEPGSTIKILTVASAIDQGVFDPNETYEGGTIDVADTTIRDWDRGGRGTLTMRQALSWSSNVGMVKLEQRMPERWQRYLQEFGFGRSTYSGLYGETKGTLPEDNVVSQTMSAFGQAIGVSQFQMLQAFTAVSNDGVMVKPQVIKKIVDPTSSDEVVSQPEVVGHPITAESAQTVREYMRDTVEDSGYGTAYGQYDVPGYHIAAKTGTAQISQDGGYLTGASDFIYSSVTMLPAEDPKYVLYVTMKRPKEANSTIIPSIANPLLKRAMDLYDVDLVEDSGVATTEKVVVQDYRNLETDAAAQDVQRSGLTPIVIGDGAKVTKQSIKNGQRLLPSEKLILLTDSQNRYMPDTTGWSKADLIKFGELLEVDVKFEGEGFCVEQSLAPYDLLTGEELTFTLKEN
ncbi:penicillin-binding transpeptidase domain-containing protein [Enterococcus olivae]